MEVLVKHGLLRSRTKANEWIVPDDEEVPMPLVGYIVSFMPFHKRGLAVPPPFLSGGGCTTMASSCST
jgi:hypothetical protein